MRRGALRPHAAEVVEGVKLVPSITVEALQIRGEPVSRSVLPRAMTARTATTGIKRGFARAPRTESQILERNCPLLAIPIFLSSRAID